VISTQLVREGATELEVPELERFRTPAGDYAPSLTKVFYNPLMEFCRDISVCAFQVVAGEFPKLWICDPLAGVGARGLRYAKEVKGVGRVVLNDRSCEAVELVKRNLELNSLTNVEVREEDANALLWEHRGRFHIVDLDPFGSPAPFVDAACASLTPNGVLALTATDTAPLSGTRVKACMRRYGARSLRTEYCHELGVRILAGFCQRVGGKHELALTPLLAHATRHYFRLYLSARRGARAADEVLAGQGYVSHCRACGRRVLSKGIVTELPSECGCGGKLEHAGPLWLGQLWDKGFIERVARELANRDFKLKWQELELLNLCAGEAGGPPTFYDAHEVARRAGVSPPKLGKALEGLRARGYFASRTHFSGTGIRSDAPFDEVMAAFH